MSTGPIDTSVDTPKDVNGRSIWPNWASQQEWQNKVHEQAVRKALDIPSDDMNIVQNKSGIGTAGALGIAGIAGTAGVAGALGSALLLGGGESTSSASAVTSPPAIVAPLDPADSSYEVLFYDADGNPIKVPHVSQLEGAK